MTPYRQFIFLLRAAFALAMIGLAYLMPTGESLWIDETTTVMYASEPTLPDLAARLASDTGSETQMPLGMLVAWAWAHLGIASEWGLRALNILWVIVAAGALSLTGRRLRLPLLPLWFCAQPFLWFYANEFRPYALQIAGAAWCLHGLVACLQERGRGAAWAWSLALGGFVMTGASLLGAIPLALVVLIAGGSFFAWRSLPEPRAWLPLGLGLLLQLLLGVHDAAALVRGAGGSRVWEIGLLNPVFALYELLGFLGLGPARLEIRDTAKAGAPALLALFRESVFGVGVLGLVYLVLLLPLRKRIEDSRRGLLAAVAAVAAGSPLMLLAAAWLAGWPFWGRHLAPVLPFFTVLIAWMTDRFTRTCPFRWLGQLVPVLLALLLLISSFTLRLTPRHRKDDYRKAAALAVEAAEQGQIVWWAAGLETARYYGVPFNETLESGGIIYPASSFEAGTGGMAAPARVFTSKPDLFDRDGRLALWLQTHQYRAIETFPGFIVWGRH